MLLDLAKSLSALLLTWRLEAKRNPLDALSCFGTDRTSTQAAAQDPLRKEGVRHKLTRLFVGQHGYESVNPLPRKCTDLIAQPVISTRTSDDGDAVRRGYGDGIDGRFRYGEFKLLRTSRGFERCWDLSPTSNLCSNRARDRRLFRTVQGIAERNSCSQS